MHESDALGGKMPEAKTVKKAQQAKSEGKSASTQAGEFVREEIHHVREGKHGARSAKQAIAIGLSKARKAGVNLPPPAPGKTSERTRKSAERAYQQGQRDGARQHSSSRRGRATLQALRQEGHRAASSAALSRQAHSAAAKRSPNERSGAAKKAARTKGASVRKTAAKKAARTRAAQSAAS
jgi:hypothetical protein